ncbi:MAG: SIS domain-containing protein [Alicyclobacillus sp.]|nr:SIS domain-containing protein [Alicyclobacillus sp.]
MNRLRVMLSRDAEDRARRGLSYTPEEIAHQPAAWRSTAAVVKQHAPDLKRLLGASLSTSGPVCLVGAGTSHFVGMSVRHVLTAAWKRDVLATASTDIVLAPELCLPSDGVLMVSYARSGESPEGNAAVTLARHLRPDMTHLVITCNPGGSLYRLGGEGGERSLSLALPPITCDRGLAMTSSYTSMVVASYGLSLLDDLDTYGFLVDGLAASAERLLEEEADAAWEVATAPFDKAVFVANRDLFGVALESHLKMREMTAGRVMCMAETTLGLRHGPMASLDDNTLVVVFVSSDPYVRRYELDLLRELESHRLGRLRIAIMDGPDPEVSSLVHKVVELRVGPEPLADLYRAPAAVVFPQLLALFRSVHEGLLPDSPSPGGVISRVVRGVSIYPYRA